MASQIKDIKSSIKTAIEAVAPTGCTVHTLPYPSTAASMEELKKDAKSEGDAAVYISYAGRRFGEVKGGGYLPRHVFQIFLFSKNYSDTNEIATDIERLLETVTNKLYFGLNYEFITDMVNPVYTKDKDLFMCVLEIARKVIFPTQT